jgi:dynactin complex subunit
VHEVVPEIGALDAQIGIPVKFGHVSSLYSTSSQADLRQIFNTPDHLETESEIWVHATPISMHRDSESTGEKLVLA